MASFATPEDLATYLRRDLDGPDTATAQQALDAATEMIRGYTGQFISEVAADVVALAGWGSRVLMLPEVPVTAVASVVIGSTTLVHPTDFQWQENGGLWRRGTAWPSFIDTDNIVTVTYTHGYAAIPEDIQVVCVEIAKRAMENPAGITRDDLNTASQWLGLTAENRAVLDRYRMVAMA